MKASSSTKSGSKTADPSFFVWVFVFYVMARKASAAFRVLCDSWVVPSRLMVAVGA